MLATVFVCKHPRSATAIRRGQDVPKAVDSLADPASLMHIPLPCGPGGHVYW